MANRVFRTLLTVILMVTLSGCLSGAGHKARHRAIGAVSSAEARLLSRSGTHVEFTGSTFRVVGEMYPTVPGAHLVVTGEIDGGLREIMATSAQTFVLSAGGWHALAPTDREIVAARLLVSDPSSFIYLLKGVSTAVEYGGVEENGKPGRRYDATVSVAALRAAAQKEGPAVGARLNSLATEFEKSGPEFPLQVDLSTSGDVLRIQYPSNPASKVMQSTEDGGAANAISVDFSPSSLSASDELKPPLPQTVN